jgi:hypothetical protein
MSVTVGDDAQDFVLYHSSSLVVTRDHAPSLVEGEQIYFCPRNPFIESPMVQRPFCAIPSTESSTAIAHKNRDHLHCYDSFRIRSFRCSSAGVDCRFDSCRHARHLVTEASAFSVHTNFCAELYGFYDYVDRLLLRMLTAELQDYIYYYYVSDTYENDVGVHAARDFPVHFTHFAYTTNTQIFILLFYRYLLLVLQSSNVLLILR